MLSLQLSSVRGHQALRRLTAEFPFVSFPLSAGAQGFSCPVPSACLRSSGRYHGASFDSPGPAKEGWSGAGKGHYPGKSDAHHGVGGGEAEVSHGFADDDVALYGQDDQRPQSDLACSRKRKRVGGGKSSSGLALPSVVSRLQRRAEGTEELGTTEGGPAS